MTEHTQTSKNLILIGWILLSILISFASFILAMWPTAGGYNIINFATLFFAFFITSRFSKYPFIGLATLLLFLDLMLVSDHALELYHLIQESFCLLGVGVMVLFKKKYYKLSIALFLVSVAYLIFIERIYLNHLYYEYPLKSDITILNENRNFLIGHHNEHPTFNSDTVYLVNFSFWNCLPCQQKKTALKTIARQYKNSPFKIVQIHSFESMEIFQQSYHFDYAVTYHDSINHLVELLKINGAPTEIIFDKKGKVARRLNGYNSEAESFYLDTTLALIKKLIRENQ